jgi:hypothetical protein
MPGLGDHPLAAIATWLGATSLSHALQTIDWLVPAIQTLHILCVALVIASVLMLFLGAFGLHGREQPLGRTYARFGPGIVWGVPVLLVTGVLMIVAEPDRALQNPVFQLKMALLVMALALSWQAARRLHRVAVAGGAAQDRPLRAFAALSLAVWVGVLVAGRWIAYALSR